MKAVYIRQYGNSSRLIYGDRPIPTPKKGQVLVRVRAAAVNPRDWIAREGKYVFKRALPPFPLILGSDISGEVVQCGVGARKFAVGTSVFGMQPLFGGMGGYAEYIAIDESALALKPDAISHIDAAAVPCAGLTAWQAIHDLGRLQSGQAITICGAAGGVGTYAVQFAKALGANVTAVCGPGSHTLAEQLGADLIVDYKKQHYTQVVPLQDVIFDAVGRDTFGRVKRVLHRNGRYVSTIPGPASATQVLASNALRMLTLGNMPSAHLVLVRPYGNQLEQIAQLMCTGQVKSVIDSVYRLEEAHLAQDRSRTWHAKGKIVLEMPH